MSQSAIDEMDELARRLAADLVRGYKSIQGQIKRPALSRKLTRQELWEKYGADYPALREDDNAWQMTVDQMGEKDACEFGREMELAMQEAMNGEAQNA